MTWHRRFYWLLILLLPTQLGVHFWPDWAHVLGRRVDYLSPTLYLTDILIVFTMISWFLSSRDPDVRRGVAISNFVRLLRRFAPRNDRLRKTRFAIIVALLFIALNIFFAANRPVAIYKWLKVIEFLLLGWYIVRTKPKLSAIILPLSIGILYSSVLAITQFFLQHSVGGPLWWLGERTFDAGTPGIARTVWQGRELLRPYGTFPHPNVLGGFLAATLPLVIISREAGSRSARQFSIFKIITIVVGVIALFLTFSRSAMVIGILALASVFFKKKQIFFSLAILFLTFSVFRFPFTFFEESVVVRQQLNAAAIHLWQTSPLVGVGLGNFLVRLPEALPTRTIYFLQPVHNIYLLLLSEVGVAGAGLIVLLVLSVLKYELRIMNYGKRKSKELFIIHTSLFIILALGLVDHYPLSLQQGQLLLTILIAMRYN